MELYQRVLSLTLRLCVCMRTVHCDKRNAIRRQHLSVTKWNKRIVIQLVLSLCVITKVFEIYHLFWIFLPEGKPFLRKSTVSAQKKISEKVTLINIPNSFDSPHVISWVWRIFILKSKCIHGKRVISYWRV